MPSIQKAQAAALSELGGIGENKNLFSPVTLSVVEKVLAQYGAEFAIKVREKLNQAQNVASGKLSDNITPEIVTEAASYRDWETDRKSTRLNSSHRSLSRMPSSA